MLWAFYGAYVTVGLLVMAATIAVDPYHMIRRRMDAVYTLVAVALWPVTLAILCIFVVRIAIGAIDRDEATLRERPENES